MQNGVSSRKLGSVILMFILGGAILLGGLTKAERDTWLALILSWAAFLPLLLVYVRIIRLHPGQDIFAIFVGLFGKLIGKLLVLAMTLYTLYLCALVLRNFGDFVYIVSLLDTPHTVIMLVMLLVVAYMAKSGFDTMAKWALVALPVYLFLIIFPVAVSIDKLKFSNLLPLLTQPARELKNTAFEYFSFPFAEIIVFLGISETHINNGKPCKVYIFSSLIGMALLLFINFRNIMLLGAPMVKALFFPSYVAIRLIDIADFMSRIEGSVSTNFILAGTVKASICLLAASKGTASLFGIGDYKRIVMPVAMLALALAAVSNKSTMEMFSFIAYYPYYALPFQILIPLLVWITAEIKHRRSKNRSSPAQA